MNLRNWLAYAHILRKRWRLIVPLFVVAVGVTTVLFLTAEPVYRAWVKLQVSVPPPTDVSLYSSFQRQEFREELAYTRSAFEELLGDGSMARRALSRADTEMEVEDFLKQTTVESEPGSSFIRVAVSADTPEKAQLLVTALVEETLNYYGGLQARPTTVSREFISQELEAAGENLVEAERALTQFKIENRIGSLDDEINHKQELILSLQKSRDQAQAEGHQEDIANYDRIIAERQRELQDLVGMSTEYESLATAVNLARGTYNLLLSKEAEAKIKESQVLDVEFIHVLSPAQLPRESISSFSPKIIVLSGVVALIVGVMLAFGWEYLETQLGETERDEQAVPVPLAPVEKSP